MHRPWRNRCIVNEPSWPCFNSQMVIGQPGTWHFSGHPNNSNQLLPSEWNKLIVSRLYFNWSLSCLFLTTSGHACIRKQNTESSEGVAIFCHIIFHTWLLFVDYLDWKHQLVNILSNLSRCDFFRWARSTRHETIRRNETRAVVPLAMRIHSLEPSTPKWSFGFFVHW